MVRCAARMIRRTPDHERGLSRQLSSVHQAMMAIGGALGTGLFLASSPAIGAAGPAVVVSYVIVAGIATLLGRALTEMAVAHPTAGAFGVYAGMYVSPFAGYAVRVSYFLMQIIASGAQLVAAAGYMRVWMPGVPSFVWVIAFAGALLVVNAREVGRLGTVEAWLVLVKLAAVGLFVILASLVVVGALGGPAVGAANLTRHGGYAPLGVAGIAFGCCFATYSFVGVEIVGVTSGEARDPGRTIPRAMRQMVIGLSAVYLITLTLLTMLHPWNQFDQFHGTDSPFVRVLGAVGLPAAAGVMNFVVLSAALSSTNANLYLISRTLFSLARAGAIPAALGVVGRHGTPLAAVVIAALGLGAAALISGLWPETAYAWLYGAALFGALFVWLMIFVTHIAFRGAERPLASYLGGAAVLGVLVATWWVPFLDLTLIVAGPWLLLLIGGYAVSRRSMRRVLAGDAPSPGDPDSTSDAALGQ
jgi:amino acid transporter, AAT family